MCMCQEAAFTLCGQMLNHFHMDYILIMRLVMTEAFTNLHHTLRHPFHCKTGPSESVRIEGIVKEWWVLFPDLVLLHHLLLFNVIGIFDWRYKYKVQKAHSIIYYLTVKLIVERVSLESIAAGTYLALKRDCLSFEIRDYLSVYYGFDYFCCLCWLGKSINYIIAQFI